MADLTALSDAELCAQAVAALETDPEHDRDDFWAIVRQALVDRLDDTDDETRFEAMLGLARRGDTRADAAVAAAMAQPDAHSLVQDAADFIARRGQRDDDRSR
jgi:hypothetical protein